MTKLKTKFMNTHPLRKVLEKSDWNRIQAAIDSEVYDSVTDDELDAAHDVFYDAIAGKTQTHLGCVILQ